MEATPSMMPAMICQGRVQNDRNASERVNPPRRMNAPRARASAASWTVMRRWARSRMRVGLRIRVRRPNAVTAFGLGWAGLGVHP